MTSSDTMIDKAWLIGLVAVLGFVGALLLVSRLNRADEPTVRLVTPEPDRVPAEPGPELRAVMSDGEVTFEEYSERALAFKACVEAGGYSLVGFKLNPTTRLYDYGLPNDYRRGPELRQMSDRCYRVEFKDAATVWHGHQVNALGAGE